MPTSFKKLFDDTRAALAAAPDEAHSAFASESRLAEGFRSEVRVRDFAFAADEPVALGGEDTAPNPVEYLLAALGTCQEITYRLYADALGIPLNRVSVKLEGTLDLRGFLDVDKAVRPGFKGIHGTVAIDSPASDDEIARLKKAVDAHCPVLDNLRNPTAVSLAVARTNESAEAAE